MAIGLYITQGGGFATYDDNHECFVWHSEIPDYLGPGVGRGDPIPKEWSTAPANEAARREISGDYS